MCADVSSGTVDLINGIDGTDVGGQIDLLQFLLFLVEFVNAIDSPYPKFTAVLFRDEGDRVVRGIIFQLLGLRVYTLEIIVTACPYLPVFVTVDASDVFVGTNVRIFTFL